MLDIDLVSRIRVFSVIRYVLMIYCCVVMLLFSLWLIVGSVMFMMVLLRNVMKEVSIVIEIMRCWIGVKDGIG